MKLKQFLLHETQVGELCVITDCGWKVASCWIDSEDLFAIPERYSNREVKEDRWGKLAVTTQEGNTVKVPCHYIEVV